ncbi:MAG TPA: transporter substrate-binding domain-containing protein [Xanthobacteraceae bacterium]|nr:transporter substrate-binding domain-containing protein [Xanthobacteraceae bacterium]
MTPDPRTTDIAQAGVIRLAMFLPQYTKDAATGALRGLGPGRAMIEIARALAARLPAKLLIVEQPTPRAALDCIKAGGCEFAFLGIEPSRAAEIDFTPAVFQFDYSFLVPAGSSLRHFADADRAGIRISVVRNHASTMALSRMAKHAELIGFDLPDDAFAALQNGKAAAFAAPRQILVEYAERLPGSRVLDEGYGINRVGMAVAKHRHGLLSYLTEFVDEANASGLLARLITDAGLHGFDAAS